MMAQRKNTFYAPDVGLVKEIQEGKKGNPTYILELVSYDELAVERKICRERQAICRKRPVR